MGHVQIRRKNCRLSFTLTARRFCSWILPRPRHPHSELLWFTLLQYHFNGILLQFPGCTAQKTRSRLLKEEDSEYMVVRYNVYADSEEFFHKSIWATLIPMIVSLASGNTKDLFSGARKANVAKVKPKNLYPTPPSSNRNSGIAYKRFQITFRNLRPLNHIRGEQLTTLLRHFCQI